MLLLLNHHVVKEIIALLSELVLLAKAPGMAGVPTQMPMGAPIVQAQVVQAQPVQAQVVQGEIRVFETLFWC